MTVTLVSLAIWTSLVLALALDAASLLPRKAASVRRWLVLLGISAALVLPLLSWAAQGRQVVHVAVPRAVAHVFAEALSTAASSTASPLEGAHVTAPPSSSMPWATRLGVGWLGVALLLLGRLLAGG